MLAYTAREGMDGRESVEFANKALVLSDEELGRDGSRPPSVGAARNGALDRLGVLRYEGCGGGG